jgi:hypothetical protein
MNYILFDDETRLSLLPFTFTRPVSEIRIGILTIREKWEKYLNQPLSFFTEKYLSYKFPLKIEADNILINGSVLPDESLIEELKSLKPSEKLSYKGSLLAWRIRGDELKSISSLKNTDFSNARNYSSDVFKINFSWDICSENKRALADDFSLITKGRISQPISNTNQVISPENIFLGEGAKVECSILNATEGIIYIGRNAEVMEGALVRGAFALCESAQLRMGAKVYGPTTIGPHCRVLRSFRMFQ